MNTVDARRESRRRMVREQIANRDVRDESVLQAMRTVPRHEFVPAAQRDAAYDDRALPLGPQQTISQPYIVALMTELAADGARGSALEVGTGSGYQAAVLAELFGSVHTIELDPALAEQAAQRLAALRYRNVLVRAGDGRTGWPDAAPFDAIVVTAGAPDVPAALLAQLAVGGRLVFPHAPAAGEQMLVVVQRVAAGRCERRAVRPVRFVPLR